MKPRWTIPPAAAFVKRYVQATACSCEGVMLAAVNRAPFALEYDWGETDQFEVLILGVVLFKNVPLVP